VGDKILKFLDENELKAVYFITKKDTVDMVSGD
jgi:hypothetical protein